MELKDNISKEAAGLGFDEIGFTDASPIAGEAQFDQWIERGFAGTMNYMHRNRNKRFNPAALLDGAKSVIVVVVNIKPTPQEQPAIEKCQGRVAMYAHYEDYHNFIKQRLFKLASYIDGVTSQSNKYKFCVDSVPLAERALAVRAGLGFVGKNHMFISHRFGPSVLLGEIITDLDLNVTTPAHIDELINSFGCCECDMCVHACPTGALLRDDRFDASRCISYLTIEHKGEIPAESADKIGDHLFGCDECVLTCPHFKNAPPRSNPEIKTIAELAAPDLEKILEMSPADFKKLFTGTCLFRTGLENLKRNASLCIKNLENK